MDQHETLCALKALAVALGRNPTRAEFCASAKGAQYALQAHFKNYTVLMQAAGLETYNERRKKITNEVFARPIQQHIENYQPREITIDRKPWPKISTISDIHWPFSSQKVIDRFYQRVEEFQPAWVILNGDAWDMYSHSKFARSHNQFTPREEHSLAQSQNETFWQKITAIAPDATRVQMLGNHDLRPLKRVLENYPEAEDWIEEMVKKSFTFTGVKTVFDPREELMIGDIAVFHGYRSQLGQHRDYTLFNCINGHSHSGGVAYRQIRGQVLWELNSGYAGDPEAKGLTYTPQKITHWTPGFGEVDSMGARFIPFR